MSTTGHPNFVTEKRSLLLELEDIQKRMKNRQINIDMEENQDLKPILQVSGVYDNLVDIKRFEEIVNRLEQIEDINQGDKPTDH